MEVTENSSSKKSDLLCASEKIVIATWMKENRGIATISMNSGIDDCQQNFEITVNRRSLW